MRIRSNFITARLIIAKDHPYCTSHSCLSSLVHSGSVAPKTDQNFTLNLFMIQCSILAERSVRCKIIIIKLMTNKMMYKKDTKFNIIVENLFLRCSVVCICSFSLQTSNKWIECIIWKGFGKACSLLLMK